MKIDESRKKLHPKVLKFDFLCHTFGGSSHYGLFITHQKTSIHLSFLYLQQYPYMTRLYY